MNKEEFLYPTSTVKSEMRPEDPAVVERILTSVARTLDGSLDCPDRAAILVAFGALGAGRELPEGYPGKIMDLLPDPDKQTIVRIAAALALGLLQRADAPVLAALRDTILNAEIPEEVRATAALAIGILETPAASAGREEARRALRHAAGTGEPDEIASCAILAMGATGDPAFVPDLEAMTRLTEDRSAGRRARAVSALGKIGERWAGADSPEIVELFKHVLADGEPLANRAVAIAMGQIGRRSGVTEDTRTDFLAMLGTLSRNDREEAAGLALLSLGRIGGVPDPEVRKRVFDILFMKLRQSTEPTVPFAALALGLLGRSDHVSREERETVRLALTDRFSDGTAAASDRPVFTLALGLLKDPGAAPLLTGLLADRQADSRLRGYAAIALALIGDPAAGAAIRSGCRGSEDGNFLVLASIATGSLGSGDTAPDLIPILTGQDSGSFRRYFAARAVGKTGDRRAVEPLLAMLVNSSSRGSDRAAAAIALADLYDRADSLVLPRLIRDLNWTARPSTLDSILSIL